MNTRKHKIDMTAHEIQAVRHVLRIGLEAMDAAPYKRIQTHNDLTRAATKFANRLRDYNAKQYSAAKKERHNISIHKVV